MIVAGRMSRLAGEKSRAASDADLAVSTLGNAEQAEAQRAGRGQLRPPHRAVDDSFTKVSESKLLDVPGLQPLRLDLLKSALAFYDEFLKERGDDAALQADPLQTRLRTGHILVMLGRMDDATAAFRPRPRALSEPSAPAPATSSSRPGWPTRSFGWPLRRLTAGLQRML